MLSFSTLQGEVKRLEDRLIGYSQHPREEPSDREALLEEIALSLEELHVAMEEMQEQQDRLAETHNDLRQQQERYQDLFEFAPSPYLVTDVNGVIQEANIALAAMLACPKGLLLGKPFIPFVSSSSVGEFYHYLKRIRNGDLLAHCDLLLQATPHSPPKLCRAWTLACQNDKGELTEIRWIFEHREERLHAEELYRRFASELVFQVSEQTQQLVLQSEEHRQEALLLHRALQCVGHEFFRIDCCSRAMRLKPGAATLLGWNGKGDPDLRWWLGGIHPEDRERVRASLERALTSLDAEWSETYRFERDSSTLPFHLRHHGVIVRDEFGKALEMACAVCLARCHKEVPPELRLS